jgi:hypothetical protein
VCAGSLSLGYPRSCFCTPFSPINLPSSSTPICMAYLAYLSRSLSLPFRPFSRKLHLGRVHIYTVPCRFHIEVDAHNPCLSPQSGISKRVRQSKSQTLSPPSVKGYSPYHQLHRDSKIIRSFETTPRRNNVLQPRKWDTLPTQRPQNECEHKASLLIQHFS